MVKASSKNNANTPVVSSNFKSNDLFSLKQAIATMLCVTILGSALFLGIMGLMYLKNSADAKQKQMTSMRYKRDCDISTWGDAILRKLRSTYRLRAEYERGSALQYHEFLLMAADILIDADIKIIESTVVNEANALYVLNVPKIFGNLSLNAEKSIQQIEIAVEVRYEEFDVRVRVISPPKKIYLHCTQVVVVSAVKPENASVETVPQYHKFFNDQLVREKVLKALFHALRTVIIQQTGEIKLVRSGTLCHTSS